MARQSTQKMKSEVGDSRESRIAALIANGFKNDAILSAFEQEDESLLQPKDPRRKSGMETFNKIHRQRLLEAIRSVRLQVTTDNDNMSEVIAELGDGEMKSIADIVLTNVARFSTNLPAMDYIYGQTEYIHLDGPKRGQPTGKIEIGLPESFLSIWAGSQGVGKTRLAIAVAKALNKMKHLVLFYNGEEPESRFRVYCGMDVDEKLFLVRSTQTLRMDKIVQDALKFKPKVIFVDSLQMIAEAGNNAGVKRVLARFRLLVNDPAAGFPHIIFISQLNKKGELAGSRFIQHMVDFVANAKKLDGREGQFLFECPHKNRGGATPRRVTFRHARGTVECVTMDRSQSSEMKLVQNNVIAGPPVPVDNDALRQVVPFVPA